jgi:hypothetical protein
MRMPDARRTLIVIQKPFDEVGKRRTIEQTVRADADGGRIRRLG